MDKARFIVRRTFFLLATTLLMTLLFGAAYLAVTMTLPEAPEWASIAVAGGTILLTVLLVGFPERALTTWHEERLAYSRGLYASLYDDSPVPYLTIDMKGRITSLNRRASLLLGTSETVLKKPLSSFLRHENPDHLTVISGHIDGGHAITEDEIQVATVSGEVRWVTIHAFLDPKIKQRLVTLVDITEHKLVDKAKSEFVALATHQLRTPIAAIRWNVELLDRSVRSMVNEKQAGYLLKVNRNVARMLALINDFLSVSKLETGSFATNPEPLELASYLPTIIEEYEGQITEKQIKLETRYDPDPLTITTDTRLFHIISSNLLSNAVKYVRPGDRIVYQYTIEGNELVFTVADSGIGIPEDQLPRLFSKFFRASNAMQHRAEGTGLGLYIVKESVAQLGGTIAVASVEGQGTTFVVRLPLSRQ